MNFPRAFSGLARIGAVAAVATVLASCGGGDQVERFAPERVIVFGDEQVALVANGTTADKYTVNALNTATPPTVDCSSFPLWPQVLASAYGFVFAQCPGGNTTTRSRNYANLAQNRATQVQAQVDGFLASADGPFNSKDLVVVSAGTHDIVDALGAGNPEAAVDQAATALALQVNRIVATGARVAFSSVPNVGSTPWGRDASRSAALTSLTVRFNTTLRSTVVNDGRKLALIDAYELVRQAVLNPPLQSFANVTDPLCTGVTLSAPSPASTTCTSGTLTTGGSVSTWLWSDNLRLSPGAQGYIGVRAADRVRSHPF